MSILLYPRERHHIFNVLLFTSPYLMLFFVFFLPALCVPLAPTARLTKPSLRPRIWVAIFRNCVAILQPQKLI